MVKDVGFNEAELKVLAFLSDGIGHALWEMCDKLGLDKDYLSKTIKELKNKGLIFNKERSLVRPGKRGPQIEYPYYIQTGQLPNITTIILSQIRYYKGKAKDADREREMLEAFGDLTPELNDNLIQDLLNNECEADVILDMFQIPLYRDCAAKIFNINCISYEGICDLIDSEFGLIGLDAEQEVGNPEDLFKMHLLKIKNAKAIESERKKLEDDTIAIKKLKERWADGERNVNRLSEATGYPSDVLCSKINQMFYCKEISL
jgi:hypothetical protein